MELHLSSVDEPWASDGDAARSAARLVVKAQGVGVLPSLPGESRLGRELLGEVVRELSSLGVARAAALEWGRAGSLEELRRAVDAASVQMDDSPLPTRTWPVLRDTLGDELLAEVLGVSASSVQRYVSGQRPTPDVVAARLHAVALVVADLRGAYNDIGVRRWFTRARVQLGGAAPLDRLRGGFDPDGEPLAEVAALAAALTAPAAT